MTFVELPAEGEQILDVVRYVNKLRSSGDESYTKYLDEATQLLQEGKYDDVLNKVIGDIDEVFGDATVDKEAEGFFNVMFSLVRKSSDMKGPVPHICEKLSGSTERSGLRLKLFSMLYNSLAVNNQIRYTVFTYIVKYAAKASRLEILAQHLEKVESLLGQWGSSVQERRDLHLLLHSVYRDTPRSEDAHSFATKYLESFNGKECGADTMKVAAEVAIEAIRLPKLYQCDNLLELDAVKKLESQANTKNLYHLLRIFALEKLEAYNDFVKKNPSALKDLKLDEKQCHDKMRLLSLASLAAEHREIPYDLIRSTLQIEEDDIEAWVIRSISFKLLDARMDQLRRVVIITRCTQRVFNQWSDLSKRLHGWNSSIKNLLEVIKNARVSHQNVVEQAAGAM